MAVTFSNNSAEIRVQYFPGRLNPSLVVSVDNQTELVAPFKGEYEAKLFVKTLQQLLNRRKDD